MLLGKGRCAQKRKDAQTFWQYMGSFAQADCSEYARLKLSFSGAGLTIFSSNV